MGSYKRRGPSIAATYTHKDKIMENQTNGFIQKARSIDCCNLHPQRQNVYTSHEQFPIKLNKWVHTKGAVHRLLQPTPTKTKCVYITRTVPYQIKQMGSYKRRGPSIAATYTHKDKMCIHHTNSS